MNAAARALGDNLILGRYQELQSFSKESILCIILFILSFLSAIMLIYVKDMNRVQFNEIQALQREETHLQAEWSQLLLEEGALKTHSRIQQAAVAKLNMYSPSHNRIILIKP